MPSGLGMAHGKKEKGVRGFFGGTKPSGQLGQLGGDTLPTPMVIAYKQEAMAQQS